MSPTLPKPNLNRENLRLEKGDVDVALGYYGKMIALDNDSVIRIFPEFFEAFFNRSGIKLELKDFDGAIENYLSEAALQPYYSYTFFSLRLVFEDKNDTASAMANFTKAIEKESDFANAYERRGLLF